MSLSSTPMAALSYKRELNRPPPPTEHPIKAESNMLRLPFFALRTKGLKMLEGFECTGTITRNQQTYAFTFSITRNTKTIYPGPLSRAAHQAFLSIATEHGFPLQNPIPWQWRDLCRRMGITYSGRTVLELKDAIDATAALTIRSHQALWSKAANELISTKARSTTHLYDRVVFINTKLPDGTTADTNYLWLSDWYLANLNAFYTTPIDYDLWRYLDKQTPIASRLYEFSLPKYHVTPIIRINYRTLAQTLPIKPERYYSKARQQLADALKATINAKVFDAVQWEKRKAPNLAQLRFHPGERTAPANSLATPLIQEEAIEFLRVKQLTAVPLTPEVELVTTFYRLWIGQEKHPTPKELAQANTYFKQYGKQKAKALIPRVVELMKQHWPTAKAFGAVDKYIAAAAEHHDADRKRDARIRTEAKARHEEHQAAKKQRAEEAKLREQFEPIYRSLPPEQRRELRTAAAIPDNPFSRRLDDFNVLVMIPCLQELANRSKAGQGSVARPQS